jgi:ribosomal-protein-alanine N-acetyltransferase
MMRMETRRLIGEPAQRADAALAVQLFGDPEVARWIWPEGRNDSEGPGPRSPDQAVAILDRLVARWQDEGIGWWFLRERAGGTFVGEVGLQRTDVEGEPVVEVGWTLLSRYWGRGYATEAAEAALSFGFGPLGLSEVVAFTMPHNTGSLRVMEKLGMTYDREFVRAGLPHVLYRVRPAI